MLLQTELGAGSLDDRDLAEALTLVRDAGDDIPGDRQLLQAVGGGACEGLQLRAGGGIAAIGRITSGSVAARFGFVPDPRPPQGQPDC
jgi:hypothetical protein